MQPIPSNHMRTIVDALIALYSNSGEVDKMRCNAVLYWLQENTVPVEEWVTEGKVGINSMSAAQPKQEAGDE